MDIIYFIIFFVITWLGLMQIYRFSTYHKYFMFALPVLGIYAALVAGLFFLFGLGELVGWYIGATSLALFLNYKKQGKSMTAYQYVVGDSTNWQKSLEKTLHYHMLSSWTYVIFLGMALMVFESW